MINLENNINSNPYLDDSDEIDFRKYLNFLLRNKKLIGISSTLFFIIACIFSFFVKKTWEGEFEIVLDLGDARSSSLVESLSSRFFHQDPKIVLKLKSEF